MKRTLYFTLLLPLTTMMAVALPPRLGLVDLSHPYDERTIGWFDSANFSFTSGTAGEQNGFFYASNNMATGEHTGTHMDAPYHFNPHGLKVADIPLQHLIVNGIGIKAREEAEADANYELPVSKLAEWEKRHGNITCPTFIVVDFGWAKRYPDRSKYFGSKTFQENDLNFPGISFQAAKWVAQHQHVVGIGTDTASVDSGANSVNPRSHIILNGANKYMLENLALDGVTLPDDRRFQLYITPMKIKEGTGAPCRVVAALPQP